MKKYVIGVLSLIFICILLNNTVSAFTQVQGYDATVGIEKSYVYALNSKNQTIYGPSSDVGDVMNHLQHTSVLSTGSRIFIYCETYPQTTQINWNASDSIDFGHSFGCANFQLQNSINESSQIWTSRTNTYYDTVTSSYTNQVLLDFEYNGPFDVVEPHLSGGSNATGSTCMLFGNTFEIAQLEINRGFVMNCKTAYKMGHDQWNEDWIHIDGVHTTNVNCIVQFTDYPTTVLMSDSDNEADHYLACGNSGINGTVKATNSAFSIMWGLGTNQTVTSIIQSLIWDVPYHF